MYMYAGDSVAWPFQFCAQHVDQVWMASVHQYRTDQFKSQGVVLSSQLSIRISFSKIQSHCPCYRYHIRNNGCIFTHTHLLCTILHKNQVNTLRHSLLIHTHSSFSLSCTYFQMLKVCFTDLQTTGCNYPPTFHIMVSEIILHNNHNLLSFKVRELVMEGQYQDQIGRKLPIH